MSSLSFFTRFLTRRFGKREIIGLSMADDETGNPFVDRMRRLDSEAKVGIEGTHEQSVEELRKLNTKRVHELVEENNRRIALIESTQKMLVTDALETTSRISPEMIGDAGEISFISEAFSWYGEKGIPSFNIPGDLLVCTRKRSHSYRTQMNIKGGSSRAHDIFGGGIFKRSFYAPDGKKVYESENGKSSYGDGSPNMTGMVFAKNFYPVAYLSNRGVEIIELGTEGGVLPPVLLKNTPGSMVDISPNGKIVCTYGRGRLRLWSLRTKECYREIFLGIDDLLKFSPDGEFIAVTNNNEVSLIHPLDGSIIKSQEFNFKTRKCSIVCIAFHPSRPIMAVGGGVLRSSAPTNATRRGEVILWDTREKKKITEFEGLEAPVSHLDFSPDGTTLAVAFTNQQIHLLDVDSGERTVLNNPPTEPIISLQFNPSGINQLEGFDVMMSGIKRMIKASDLKLTTKNHIDFTLSWERRVQL